MYKVLLPYISLCVALLFWTLGVLAAWGFYLVRFWLVWLYSIVMYVDLLFIGCVMI